MAFALWYVTLVPDQLTAQVHLSEILHTDGQTFFPSFDIFLASIIDLLVGFAGLIALIGVIWAGYDMMLGEEEDNKKGKERLRESVFGLVAVLLAYIAVTVVQALLFR